MRKQFARSLSSQLVTTIGGSRCLQGLPVFSDSSLESLDNSLPASNRWLGCFQQCLPRKSEVQSSHADASVSEAGGERTSLDTQSEGAGDMSAWVGHWVMFESENEKADAAMKKQGVPMLIRKLLLRWKAERKFHIDEEGHLVLHSKSMTGRWVGE